MNLGTWLIRKVFYTRKPKPRPPKRKYYEPTPRPKPKPKPPQVRYGHCPTCDAVKKTHQVKKSYVENLIDGWYWWIWYYLLVCQTCDTRFRKDISQEKVESEADRLARLELERLRRLRQEEEDRQRRKRREEDERRRAKRRRQSSQRSSSYSSPSRRSSGGFGGGFSGGGGAGRSGRSR